MFNWRKSRKFPLQLWRCSFIGGFQLIVEAIKFLFEHWWPVVCQTRIPRDNGMPATVTFNDMKTSEIHVDHVIQKWIVSTVNGPGSWYQQFSYRMTHLDDSPCRQGHFVTKLISTSLSQHKFTFNKYIKYITQRWIQYFPDGGERQPPSLWQKNIIWLDFCQKLHENEINWTERGFASLKPPWIHQCISNCSVLAEK